MKEAQLRDEQKYTDNKIRGLSDSHLLEKMEEQIKNAKEVNEKCVPLIPQTLSRLQLDFNAV